LPKIGQAFGGKDHTTVLHACEKIQNEIQKNAETRRAVSEMKKKYYRKVVSTVSLWIIFLLSVDYQ